MIRKPSKLELLPSEVQTKIFKDVDDRDCLHLAVVCKEVSRNILPILYRSSVLLVPPTEEPTPTGWGTVCWSKSQQNRYCKTILSRPELGGYAKSVQMRISQNSLFGQPVNVAPWISQVVKALGSLSNIGFLEVHQDMNALLPRPIFENLPPSLVTVNLEHSALSPQDTLALFKSLPLLKNLYVTVLGGGGTNKKSYSPVHHSNLECLSMNFPQISPSLFQAITYDTPRLTVLELDFDGLSTIKGSPSLGRLKELFIVGKLCPVMPNAQSVARDLITIFSETPNLETFAIHSATFAGINQDITILIERLDIFRFLPKTVSNLELIGFHSKPAYLLSTVQRLAPQLKRLKLSTVYPMPDNDEARRWKRGVIPDKVTEGNIKAICQANRVEFIYKDRDAEQQAIEGQTGEGDCRIA